MTEKPAGLDLRALIEKHAGQNYALHAEHINPANVRTLKTIGFDRCYVRAEGPTSGTSKARSIWTCCPATACSDSAAIILTSAGS